MRFITTFGLLVLFALNTSAQTGPGGIGTSATNELWLVVQDNAYVDAGNTPGGNNSSIQQWNDISGNSRHAVQVTTSMMPTLLNNQTNGLSVLRFDGSTDRILSVGVSTANVATIFVVVRFNQLTNNNDGIIHASPPGTSFSGTTTDKAIGMWINTTSGAIWGRGVQSNNTIRDVPQTTALTVGQFYLITQQYDGTNITQYVNGVTAGSNTYNGTLKSWSDFGIGRQAAESLDGDIAEIIVHRASLNTAQRIITENYLAAKYGLALDANDLYNEDDVSGGNYDHEVAGIGRVDATNLHTNARGSAMVQIHSPTNLGNGEFMLWGHDGGIAMATNTSDVPSGVHARLNRVWRVSEVNSSGTAINVGAVNMRWDLSGLGPVTTTDLVLLFDTDNDGSFADETPVTGASSLGGDLYEFAGMTGLTNNRRFTLGTTNLSQTPLPVTLSNFYGERRPDHRTQISWETLSERNTSHFLVQRSLDGTSWTTIAKVDARGHSLTEQKYTATDDFPADGNVYYRLQMIDQDGRFTYSRIIVIGGNSEEVKVFPNPTKDTFVITGSAIASELRLLTIQGIEISNFEFEVLEDGKILVSLTLLPDGVYILKIGSGYHRIVKCH